jgi:hypothetical protein
VGGFNILPTRVKSGREFAPQHKKGTSKYVTRVKLTYGQKGWKKNEKNHKGYYEHVLSVCILY